MERQCIAVDMDNVLADVTTQLSEWYYNRTGIWISEEQMIGHHETAVFPDPKLARSFLYEPDFFYSMKLLPDAQEVLAEMNKQHDIFIVSAAMEFPNSLIEKYNWLEKYFPFLGWQQFVLCGSKAIIKADWLIDDHLKNLDYFDGEKLLFYAPHNVGIDKYRRVNKWKEVGDIFL